MLTIIIPTMNRPDFLRRLLAYYSKMHVSYVFFVVDGSAGEYVVENRQCIQEFSSILSIRHFELPGSSIAKSIKSINMEVQTPYVVPLPDDDLLMPTGVNAAIRFLETHQDYVAANGFGGLFILQSTGPFGAIKDVGDYALRGVEGSTSLLRFKNLFNDYFVVHFSICRTEIWRAMWEYTDDIEDVSIAAEMLPCSIAVILGKVKHLNILYLLRQGHDRRYLVKTGFDWMVTPVWASAVLSFERILGKFLAENEKIPIDIAEKQVRNCFWKRLNNSLILEHRRYANTLQVSRVHKTLSFYNTFRVIFKLKAKYLNMRRAVSLDKLLDPHQPMYQDFKPLYDLLVGCMKSSS